MINCTFYTTSEGDESICKWDASTVGHNAIMMMIELEWGKVWELPGGDE